MLTAIGLPLLHALDDGLDRLHRFVRTWRAVLEGDCWSQAEAATRRPGDAA